MCSYINVSTRITSSNNALYCIIGLRLRKNKNIVIYSNTVIVFAMIYRDNTFQYRPALLITIVSRSQTATIVQALLLAVCAGTNYNTAIASDKALRIS